MLGAAGNAVKTVSFSECGARLLFHQTGAFQHALGVAVHFLLEQFVGLPMR